jgi:hypothetical protein
MRYRKFCVLNILRGHFTYRNSCRVTYKSFVIFTSPWWGYIRLNDLLVFFAWWLSYELTNFFLLTVVYYFYSLIIILILNSLILTVTRPLRFDVNLNLIVSSFRMWSCNSRTVRLSYVVDHRVDMLRLHILLNLILHLFWTSMTTVHHTQLIAVLFS